MENNISLVALLNLKQKGHNNIELICNIKKEDSKRLGNHMFIA